MAVASRKPVFQNPRPMADAVSAVPREGVVFKDGVDDGVEVQHGVPTDSFRADQWPHAVDVEKDEVLAFFLADRRGVAASNRLDLLWISFLRDHGQ